MNEVIQLNRMINLFSSNSSRRCSDDSSVTNISGKSYKKLDNVRHDFESAVPQEKKKKSHDEETIIKNNLKSRQTIHNPANLIKIRESQTSNFQTNPKTGDQSQDLINHTKTPRGSISLAAPNKNLDPNRMAFPNHRRASANILVNQQDLAKLQSYKTVFAEQNTKIEESIENIYSTALGSSQLSSYATANASSEISGTIVEKNEVLNARNTVNLIRLNSDLIDIEATKEKENEKVTNQKSSNNNKIEMSSILPAISNNPVLVTLVSPSLETLNKQQIFDKKPGNQSRSHSTSPVPDAEDKNNNNNTDTKSTNTALYPLKVASCYNLSPANSTNHFFNQCFHHMESGTQSFCNIAGEISPINSPTNSQSNFINSAKKSVSHFSFRTGISDNNSPAVSFREERKSILDSKSPNNQFQGHDKRLSLQPIVGNQHTINARPRIVSMDEARKQSFGVVDSNDQSFMEMSFTVENDKEQNGENENNKSDNQQQQQIRQKISSSDQNKVTMPILNTHDVPFVGNRYNSRPSRLKTRYVMPDRNRARNASNNSDKETDQNCGPNRISAWSINFDSLMNDEIGIDYLTKFLKSQYANENIEFYLKCLEFESLFDFELRKTQNQNQAMEQRTPMENENEEKKNTQKNPLKRHLSRGDTDIQSIAINITAAFEIFKEIYEKFIKDPIINLESYLIKDYNEKIAIYEADPYQIHRDSIKQQKNHIYKLLKTDCYPRFLKSETYKTLFAMENFGGNRSNDSGGKFGRVSCVDKRKREVNFDRQTFELEARSSGPTTLINSTNLIETEPKNQNNMSQKHNIKKKNSIIPNDLHLKITENIGRLSISNHSPSEKERVLNKQSTLLSIDQIYTKEKDNSTGVSLPKIKPLKEQRQSALAYLKDKIPTSIQRITKKRDRSEPRNPSKEKNTSRGNKVLRSIKTRRSKSTIQKVLKEDDNKQITKVTGKVSTFGESNSMERLAMIEMLMNPTKVDKEVEDLLTTGSDRTKKEKTSEEKKKQNTASVHKSQSTTEKPYLRKRSISQDRAKSNPPNNRNNKSIKAITSQSVDCPTLSINNNSTEIFQNQDKENTQDIKKRLKEKYQEKLQQDIEEENEWKLAISNRIDKDNQCENSKKSDNQLSSLSIENRPSESQSIYYKKNSRFAVNQSSNLATVSASVIDSIERNTIPVVDSSRLIPMNDEDENQFLKVKQMKRFQSKRGSVSLDIQTHGVDGTRESRQRMISVQESRKQTLSRLQHHKSMEISTGNSPSVIARRDQMMRESIFNEIQNSMHRRSRGNSKSSRSSLDKIIPNPIRDGYEGIKELARQYTGSKTSIERTGLLSSRNSVESNRRKSFGSSESCHLKNIESQMTVHNHSKKHHAQHRNHKDDEDSLDLTLKERIELEDKRRYKRDRSMRRDASPEIYTGCESTYRYLKVELFNGTFKIYRLSMAIYTVEDALKLIAKNESLDSDMQLEYSALDCYLKDTSCNPPRLYSRPLDNKNPITAIVHKSIRIERRSIFRLDLLEVKRAVGIRAKWNKTIKSALEQVLPKYKLEIEKVELIIAGKKANNNDHTSDFSNTQEISASLPKHLHIENFEQPVSLLDGFTVHVVNKCEKKNKNKSKFQQIQENKQELLDRQIRIEQAKEKMRKNNNSKAKKLLHLDSQELDVSATMVELGKANKKNLDESVISRSSEDQSQIKRAKSTRRNAYVHGQEKVDKTNITESETAGQAQQVEVQRESECSIVQEELNLPPKIVSILKGKVRNRRASRLV